MKEVSIALIAAFGPILVAVLSASWFKPELLRLDILFPTSEVEILDDLMLIHFDYYRERGTSSPVESYTEEYSNQSYDVFDKATYTELIRFKKTSGDYQTELISTGVLPEVVALFPPMSVDEQPQLGNLKRIVAKLDLSQSETLGSSEDNPSSSAIYIYRNGYQGSNSWGGKNVEYKTRRLTLVYDFSNLSNNGKALFQDNPSACILRNNSKVPVTLNVEMNPSRTIAVVKVLNVERYEKLRIFWRWNRIQDSATPFEKVTCKLATS